MNSIQINKNELLILALVFAILPFAGIAFGLSFNNQQSFNAEDEMGMSSAYANAIAVSPVATDNKTIINEPEQDIKSNQPDNILRFDVQANVFADFNNAAMYKKKLEQMGIKAQIAFGSFVNNDRVYRIVVASFDTKEDAVDYVNQLPQRNDLILYIKRIGIQSDLSVAAI